MTIEEDIPPPSRLALQETLAAVFSAREEIDRILREEYPIGAKVLFVRDSQQHQGLVMNPGWNGTLNVQIAPSNDRRRVSAQEVVPSLALQDALAAVAGAEAELNRVVREEYPAEVGVVFVSGVRRVYGTVVEHGEHGDLVVRLRNGKTKRIGAHQIRA